MNEICIFTTGSFPDEIEEANAEFMVTAVNHHQELVTRLYNLVNAVETDLSHVAEIHLRLTEARETLKKVIQ